MLFCWPEAVAIESTRTDVVAGYAPRFVPEWSELGSVVWFEGGHERQFLVKELLVDQPDELKFRDGAGHVHTLRPMTLKLYDRQVRPRTVGRPTFANMSELLSAMRSEW